MYAPDIDVLHWMVCGSSKGLFEGEVQVGNRGSFAMKENGGDQAGYRHMVDCSGVDAEGVFERARADLDFGLVCLLVRFVARLVLKIEGHADSAAVDLDTGCWERVCDFLAVD